MKIVYVLLAQTLNGGSPGSGLDGSLLTAVVSVVIESFIIIFVVVDETIHVILVSAAIIHALIVLVVEDLLKRVVSGPGLFFVVTVLLSALLQAFEFLKMTECKGC